MVTTCSFERKIFWIGSQVAISSLSLKCNINQQSMNIVKLSTAQLQKFIMFISWLMMSVDLLSHDLSNCAAAAAVWWYSSFTMMMQWHHTLTTIFSIESLYYLLHKYNALIKKTKGNCALTEWISLQMTTFVSQQAYRFCWNWFQWNPLLI